MKYKLLKNIPLANEGDVVELVYNDEVLPYIINEDNRILTYLDDDIINEWIQPLTKENPYDLKIGNSFWFIDYDNCETLICHIDSKSSYNNYYLPSIQVGNVYVRKKQAENALNKIKALNAIKEYCWNNSIELYTDDEVHELINININSKMNDREYWFILFVNNKFESEYRTTSFIDTPLKFKSLNDIDKVINDCSSELKLLFNVN